jgi:predicted MPP superfamily phosphohydrolase
MLVFIPLLLIALSIGTDLACLHTLRRFLPPRRVRLVGWLCFVVELLLVVYLVLLATARQTVMPHPHLTLCVLTVLVPKIYFLLLWLLFVLPLSRHRISLYNFLTVLLLAVLLGGSILYGGLRGRFKVEVNRVEVCSPRLPVSFDGYRIVQVSDIHLGSLTPADTVFLAEAVDSILALKPDVVCFTGDLVNIHAAELRPEFQRQLSRLRTRRHRVYAVLGNHDYADYDHTLDSDSLRRADTDSLRALIAGMGWTLLDNRGERIRHRAERRPGDFGDPTEALRILGVGNIGEPPFSTYGDLDSALATLPAKMDIDREYTILLSHNPTHWRNAVLPHSEALPSDSDSLSVARDTLVGYPDIDLMLSGHTHGMQMSFFGFSPAVWRYHEWGGLYTEGLQSLYVNTGLGTVGFPIRVGLNPEITLLTLRTVAEDDGDEGE